MFTALYACMKEEIHYIYLEMLINFGINYNNNELIFHLHINFMFLVFDDDKIFCPVKYSSTLY